MQPADLYWSWLQRWPTGVNGLAVGAEDTGIRPLLLIAQRKDLFKLEESKPVGLQWGVLGSICQDCVRGISLTKVGRGIFAHLRDVTEFAQFMITLCSSGQ